MLKIFNIGIVAIFLFCSCSQSKLGKEPMNIVFILTDDLGYGDLGYMGQEKIKTPSINSMAEEGLRFSRHYAGGPVCGPSRACLLTGLHQGHGYIKGNPGGVDQRETLRKQDLTVSEVLKSADYETVCIGKWGLGKHGTSGYPLNKGFDYFVGYDSHVAAHNYYPKKLCKNEGWLKLKPKTYTHDLFADEALSFINGEHKKPFFLYLNFTIPHLPYNPPDMGIYKDMDWPDKYKNYASMITRMDGDVGRVLAALKATGLDENTVVIFTSDNGPQSSWGAGENDMTKFFNSNGEIRGIKRDLYEGGVRVPYIVWSPSNIGSGDCDKITAFQDFFPTACDIANVETPEGLDGRSMLPLFLGDEDQFEEPSHLYWEFIRMGGAGPENWGGRQGVLDVKNGIKAVRYGSEGDVEIYDLNSDPAESTDISDDEKQITDRLKLYMDTVRTESELWPMPKEGWAKPNK